MHIATTVEQNYMYTAGATEMGRGERSNPFPLLNTPGPGAYNIYKEVKEPTATKSRKTIEVINENQDIEVQPRPKSIPKAPAPFNTMMVRVQKGDKEETRVERSLYEVLEDWKPTNEWAHQRMRISQKAKETLGGWT